MSVPPPREQLCNRYCSNKHTHTHTPLGLVCYLGIQVWGFGVWDYLMHSSPGYRLYASISRSFLLLCEVSIFSFIYAHGYPRVLGLF